MVQFILLRPGSTDYDHQSRIQGTLNIPLSDAGRKEVEKTSEQLRMYLPTAVYCSPGSSTEETAKLIGQALELKPKTLDRLLNVDLGLWQGMLVDEVRHKQSKVYKQWQEHPETVCPPEGEVLTAAAERAEEVLEKLARKHRTGAIVLVAPEPMASLVRHRIDGTELGDLWRACNGCHRLEVLTLEASLAAAATAENGKGKGNGKRPESLVYRGTIVDGR